VDEGYITRSRVGRRNEYVVDCDQQLRHPSLSNHTLRELLAGMTRPLAAGSEIRRVG
jgi:hypothetical protein